MIGFIGAELNSVPLTNQKTLMKKTLWFVCSLALLTGTVAFGQPAQARPTEGDNDPRIERLERRLNEMAQHQEQMMNRLGAPAERRLQAMQGEQSAPPIRARLDRAQQPLPPMQANAHGAAVGKAVQDTLGLLFLIALICNILMARWIYTDIRKRGEGPGIFVVMALFAGIPAAIIYALVRIGDRKPEVIMQK